jgi:hypothetical protein
MSRITVRGTSVKNDLRYTNYEKMSIKFDEMSKAISLIAKDSFDF